MVVECCQVAGHDAPFSPSQNALLTTRINIMLQPRRLFFLFSVSLSTLLYGCSLTTQSADPTLPKIATSPGFVRASIDHAGTNKLYNALSAGNCVHPKYPSGPFQRNETGKVTVKLTVDAEGNVVDISIEKSSGFTELDNGSAILWKSCHFNPATQDGVPVQSTTKMMLDWKIS
jgi:TonB family protein